MYSVVSYFSGCGGLDLGFTGGFKYHGKRYKMLPFNIIAAYDNSPTAVETYNAYFSHKAEVCDLSQKAAQDIPAATVLIGGFPCQDFSSCGPQKGLLSERGRLYTTLVDYMKQHQPEVVVGENVINLLRIGDGTVIEKIVNDFTDAGYRFEVWHLDASKYGVPQNRQRLFFIGVRNDLPGFPSRPIPSTPDQPNTIKWAIDDLIDVVDESVPNQSQYFKASKAKKGNGQGDEKSKADSPAYTIRANPKSRVQFHYALDRRLTVRECARIQTFPDDFFFPHSMTTSMFEIGNAVPPILAYQVATSIAQYLKTLGGNNG